MSNQEYLNKFMETKSLKGIPEEYITAEMCYTAITRLGSFEFAIVPEKFKTHEMCLIAVTFNGMNIQYVPEQLLTNDICVAAVQNTGMSLGFVPKEKLNRDICIAAVKNDGPAICYIPRKMIDETLRRTALVYGNGNTTLMYIPQELLTYELCEIAVKHFCPINLVPQNFLTPELVQLHNELNKGGITITQPQDENELSGSRHI